MNELWQIEDSETGTAIEDCASLEEAQKIVAAFEALDILEGIYEPGFYAIRHGDECAVQLTL